MVVLTDAARVSIPLPDTVPWSTLNARVIVTEAVPVHVPAPLKEAVGTVKAVPSLVNVPPSTEREVRTLARLIVLTTEATDEITSNEHPVQVVAGELTTLKLPPC